MLTKEDNLLPHTASNSVPDLSSFKYCLTADLRHSELLNDSFFLIGIFDRHIISPLLQKNSNSDSYLVCEHLQVSYFFIIFLQFSPFRLSK